MSNIIKFVDLFLSSSLLVTTFIIFCNIFLKNITIKINHSKLLLILFLILSYLFVGFIFNGVIKTFFMFILYTLFCNAFYKKDIIICLLTSFIFITFAFIPDIIVLYIYKNVFNIEQFYFYETLQHSFISTFFVCLIYILIIINLKIILKKRIIIKKINNKDLFLYVIICLFIILFLFYDYSISFLNNKNKFFYLVLILLFLMFMYKILCEEIAYNKIIKRYDRLLLFITSYEKEIEEQKILMHETKNQLIVIKSYLKDNLINDAIFYIDSLLNEKNNIIDEEYYYFQYLPANGLKGLFYYKVSEAKKKGIKVNIIISKKIKNSFLSNLNIEKIKQIGRIIGIYLDNAIEASYTSNEKTLGIEIYTSNNKNNIFIIISNSFQNNVNIKDLGKKRITTKGYSHGYGLMLANKILKHNNYILNETKINNNLFIEKIIIKGKKNKHLV